MKDISKYLPWAISVALAILFGLSEHDSQVRLEQKDAELATLKQQYQRLVEEANNKAAEASARMQQLAEEANKQIQIANQPEIPIRVSFRKALLASGNVTAFNNVSGQTIAVTINVTRSSSSQSRTFELTIDPGQTKEIGELEGWAFITGDSIAITQPEHKSLLFRAP